jgi:hypothetical protein
MLSFSLTFTQLYDTASMIVNDLAPAYIVPIGIGLAMMVLTAVVGALRIVQYFRYY